jgi:hypothetical protein
VYDCRISQYVPLPDVQPATFSRWLVRKENGNCSISVIAKSESDAQRSALKLFCSMIADAPRFYQSAASIADAMSTWIAAGKPVELDTRNTAPDLDPIERVFAPLGKPDQSAEQPVPDAIPETSAQPA